MSRFENALAMAKSNMDFEGSIGTLSEKTLHSVLKYYLEPCDDFHEVALDGYVADIMRDGCITEIQTRSFDRLREKLSVFLPKHPVTVVHPLIANKTYLVANSESGEFSRPKKSPKHEDIYDIFDELYKIKMHLLSENLYFHFIMLDVTEYRRAVKKNYKNHKGYETVERIPERIIDEIYIDGAHDLAKLIPPSLPTPFTSLDFAKAIKRQRGVAQTALNILCHVGAVRRTGKNKNTYLYETIEKDKV